MKRIFCMMMTVLVPLVAGTMTRTLTYSPTDFVFTKGGGYDIVELPGYPCQVHTGTPRVPRTVEAVVLPPNARVTGVRVIAEEWVVLPGTFQIVPAHPDVPLPMPGQDFRPEPVVPDPNIYSRAAWYPEHVVRMVSSGSMCGYRIAHIEVMPLRYQPVIGRVEILSRLVYELEYDFRGRSTAVAERQRQVFGEAVQRTVVNPENVRQYAPPLRVEGGASRLDPGDYEYVVISESPMDTVFQRLVDWKTQKGTPGTVISVAWISSNYSGYDLAEKVRNFIIDAWETWGTIYVLLGGSGDYYTSGQNIVPTRKVWYTYAGGGNIDSLPCDLYYSDLDRTWDFNGNHVYGQTSDSVDLYADVYVGRASVYNVAQAQNFVYKVLTYEQDPPVDYIERLLLPTAILWSSYNERPMQDSIGRMPPYTWQVSKLYERNGTLSRPAMVDSMNVGYHFGHWVGHGNENGIYMGSYPYLNSTDADNLVNGDRAGIANSIGCMCGGWDLTPGGDCFAEHLMNRQGGGLTAAIMNSRYGYGAYVSGVGYVPGPSERIDTTFYANLFWYDMMHLGQVHAVAKDAWVPYADMTGQYNMTRWCLYSLNLFGCPEMPVWTDQPVTLTVNNPGAIPMGNQNVNVVVMTEGSPLEDALVCLQKGTETYARGYTDGSGLVTLNVFPTTPGYMQITVTAKNHYPYEDSFVVQASNYAYVTFLNCWVNDADGNNNGELNAGESAQLPVWVKNWGLATGQDIAGILATTDDYAVLSDTIKDFGDIAPEDSAYTGTDGFDIQIAPNCPDEHAILFTLTCNDDVDSTWESQFSLTVHAPMIACVGYEVVGGNGNGILDPGETADIVVTLANDGSATADDVTAVLSAGSSWLVIDDGYGAFGSIDPGGTGTNAGDPFTVTADGGASYGTDVWCQLQVETGMCSYTLPLMLVIGEFVPSDTGYYYVYYSGGLHEYAPDFEWLEIGPSGPGSLISEITNEDADTVTVTLPFTFRYYGQDYTTVGVCSNGFLELGVSTYRFGANTSIPAVGGPRALVAPFWDDLDPSQAGDIYQYYDAAAHRWIVEFYQVDHYGGPGHYETFQVILCDPVYYPTPTGDGEILMEYLVGMQETGNTVGLENYVETVGVQYHCDGVYDEWAVAVTDSFALRYTTYPPDYTGISEEGGLVVVPRVTRFTGVVPNPFTRRVGMEYQVARVGVVELAVYDAVGRCVRVLAEGMREPGYYTAFWDGCDDVGRRVPAGVYFVQFVTDDYQRVEKTILVK
ncbi:MAG: hypothetical protein JSW02_05705 [candidate division WOR-3 bacterium]|nr:MAG: hypothetical protein JSW02_05705 [candidate division WOR-3 bacterium]